MKLTSLHLENIRSYDNLDIDFDDGTTLFEGDIGSGKSTLLMAIEFALFGLGGMRGNSLLRTGETEGIVRLSFNVNGEEIEVQRKLVKKRKTSQACNQSSDGCYIKTKEGILPLSPSEMKARILEILNFNEPPNPRAKSVIFTYAVFTPQEEMKSILMDKPESRLQTLRKAFRIEDYKVAVENAGSLSSELGKKVSELKGESKGLTEDIAKKDEFKSKIEEEQKKIQPLEKQKNEEDSARKKIQAELDDSRKQQNELSKVVGQIPLIQKNIGDAEARLKKLNRRIDENKCKIDENTPKLAELEKIKKPTEKEEETIESEIEELRQKERNLRKNEGVLENKIKEYGTVKEKGICPTCDRPASAEEFSSKIAEITSQKESVSQKVDAVGKQIKQKRELIKNLQGYNRAREKHKVLKDNLEQLAKSVKEDEEAEIMLEKQIDEDKTFVKKAQKKFAQLKNLDEKVKELETNDKTKENLLGDIQATLTKIQERILGFQRSIEEYGGIIDKKKTKKKQFEELSEYILWLKDYFIPTLQSIETNVMASINKDFNEKFREWFGILVDDPTKDARIDEDFTPIVDQDQYEQNIKYLSGGEKTSIALAYRLSLNSMVQRVSAGIKSNLLILDEPTDGFSREQLFKVRDILNELKCPQVILVSHEKELESFADHIHKIVKINGISKIVT